LTYLEQVSNLRHRVGNGLYEDEFGIRLQSCFHIGADVNRGEAFWIRSGDYFNRYFGTFNVSLQNLSGVRFGSDISQFRIRLRNDTDEALTVYLNLAGSETAPDGQDPVVGLPSLLLRGEFNATDLTYATQLLTIVPHPGL